MYAWLGAVQKASAVASSVAIRATRICIDVGAGCGGRWGGPCTMKIAGQVNGMEAGQVQPKARCALQAMAIGSIGPVLARIRTEEIRVYSFIASDLVAV